MNSDRTRLKICGLTNLEDARAAVEAGADYLGVILAENSPRTQHPQQLQWLDEVRADAELVGVFQDQSVDFVREVAEELDLDFVQLHGNESGDAWRNLPLRLIEACVVEEGAVPGPRLPGLAWARLLDGGRGSGRAFDWSVATSVARSQRLFLAGGLDAANVGDAVRQLRPFAVDVCSSVECAPGQKDHARLRAFAQALKEAMADA